MFAKYVYIHGDKIEKEKNARNEDHCHQLVILIEVVR